MKVLIIAAHMDDETLGMGGTIAKHVDCGDDVHVCIVCKRACDHQFRPELVEAERMSTLRAAEVLGYETPTFLDLRDELLDERLLDVIVPVETSGPTPIRNRVDAVAQTATSDGERGA